MAVSRAAGIQTVWTDSPWAPDESRSPHFRVVILSPQMTAKKCKEDQLGESVMGTATDGVTDGSGRIAYIFADRIGQMAWQYLATLDRGLGHATAHEVGDLLLGVRRRKLPLDFVKAGPHDREGLRLPVIGKGPEVRSLLRVLHAVAGRGRRATIRGCLSLRRAKRAGARPWRRSPASRLRPQPTAEAMFDDVGDHSWGLLGRTVGIGCDPVLRGDRGLWRRTAGRRTRAIP
jgi:hypothetical protein